MTRLPAKKTLISFVLFSTLLGFGQAGALVLCLGEDGHIGVVHVSGDHCCECPSSTPVVDFGHPCGSCFDIFLPFGTGAEFLLPREVGGQETSSNAAYVVSSLSLSAGLPGLPEVPQAPTRSSDNPPLACLSTVILLT